MIYKIELMDIYDGEIRTYYWPCDDAHFVWQNWVDGNYSCDCNRMTSWLCAGGMHHSVAYKKVHEDNLDICGAPRIRVRCLDTPEPFDDFPDSEKQRLEWATELKESRRLLAIAQR